MEESASFLEKRSKKLSLKWPVVLRQSVARIHHNLAAMMRRWNLVLAHLHPVWALNGCPDHIKPGIRRFERVFKLIGHGVYRSIAPGPKPLRHRTLNSSGNNIQNVFAPAFAFRTKSAHDANAVRPTFMPAAPKNLGRVLVRKPGLIPTVVNMQHALAAFHGAATVTRHRSGIAARWSLGRRNARSNSSAIGVRYQAAVLAPGGSVRTGRLISPAGTKPPRHSLGRRRLLLPAGDFGGLRAQVVRSAGGSRPARRLVPRMPSFAPSAPRASTHAAVALADVHETWRRSPMMMQSPPVKSHSTPGRVADGPVPSWRAPAAVSDERTSIGRAIETYFANQARLPPAGMTGFDPRLSPAWAGLQIPG